MAEQRKQLLFKKDDKTVNAPKPSSVASMDILKTIPSNKQDNKKRSRVRRKIYEDETTTVRIGMSLKYKTDTLIAMGKFEIVHDILDYLLDRYITQELDADEQRIFKTLYNMKSKNE